jgi:hypothetical protein
MSHVAPVLITDLYISGWDIRLSSFNSAVLQSWSRNEHHHFDGARAEAQMRGGSGSDISGTKLDVQDR